MAMAFSTKEFFTDRPALRSSASALASSLGREHVIRSPKTPALGRSVSNFGSPAPYRVENDDVLVYELSARFFSAGFAGESRPRCKLPFTPDIDRRIGDYRQYDPDYIIQNRKLRLAQKWAAGFELFTADTSHLDLALAEEKLGAVLRAAHGDYLQLDAKPRKAVLVIPPQLPFPLLEVALRVLFSHFTQPHSVTVFTCPALVCIAAGLRDALVIDIGWDETVVTAVGELKEVFHKRSVKASKYLTREVLNLMEFTASRESAGGLEPSGRQFFINDIEEITYRAVWCKSRDPDSSTNPSEQSIELEVPGTPTVLKIPFADLAEPVEETFFQITRDASDFDDHDLPLHLLVHRVLLALPLDLRSICLSRIVLTGEGSEIPGLRRRLLQELTHLSDSRGWDVVHNYGNAKDRSRYSPREDQNGSNLESHHVDGENGIALSPLKMPLQEAIPHSDRVHDDIRDPVTLKAERESAKGKSEIIKASIRGVHSLGAWAGASLMTSMTIKGAHEFDRDDFIKHGLRESTMLTI